jgi:hypothetical protein
MGTVGGTLECAGAGGRSADIFKSDNFNARRNYDRLLLRIKKEPMKAFFFFLQKTAAKYILRGNPFLRGFSSFISTFTCDSSFLCAAAVTLCCPASGKTCFQASRMVLAARACWFLVVVVGVSVGWKEGRFYCHTLPNEKQHIKHHTNNRPPVLSIHPSSTPVCSCVRGRVCDANNTRQTRGNEGEKPNKQA